MKIDWAALLLVAGVSVTMTVLFVVLLSFGIRLVSTAGVRVHGGQSGSRSAGGGVRAARARRRAGALRYLPDRAAAPLTSARVRGRGSTARLA